MLKCGSIEGVYATVDFDPSTDVQAAFAIQRKFSPHGPLVNSEFYPGWFDIWGTPHQKIDSKILVNTLNKILALNANVNFYMYHGGTNFGFSNG